MGIVILCIVCAACAYLLGGVNPAIILSKAVYHEDIRDKGSGNPGFTNFKRVYGGRVAWLVFALDIGKGVVLCLVFCPLFRAALGGALGDAGAWQAGAAYTGLFAMLGHCFPLWYGFKGGKGFLVGAATIWFIDWRAGLIALAVMMIVLAATRYMSLSVMLAALTCPVTLLATGADPRAVVFCTLGVILMIARHHANIGRLAHGTESKFSLSDKRKAAENTVS